MLVQNVLASYPIHDPKKGTLTQLTVKGSHDGTTFHLPTDGSITYEAIGQGILGTKDLLAVLPISNYSYTEANIGGTGPYGLSQVQILNFNGSVIATSMAILYANLSGVSIDMSSTNRSVINISAATSIPVDLNLSAGDDQVTIETGAATTDLAQEYTVHGNGGFDTVTFRKTAATYVDNPVNRPTDVYTIDNHQLTYQTSQSTQVPGKIDSVVGRFVDIGFDGIEDLEVDQDVIQSANFQVNAIDPNVLVSLHGPLPSDILTLIPRATYSVGSADHTLDGFLGTLRIDDRAKTGVLSLDDSAANPLVHATNSDMLAAVVTTAYEVDPGGISRTRTFAYSTIEGPTTEQSAFQIQEPDGIASVQVLAGGGTNTFGIYGTAARLHPARRWPRHRCLQQVRELGRNGQPQPGWQRWRRYLPLRRLAPGKLCEQRGGGEPRPQL